jgi:hypothetical protein
MDASRLEFADTQGMSTDGLDAGRYLQAACPIAIGKAIHQGYSFRGVLCGQSS